MFVMTLLRKNIRSSELCELYKLNAVISVTFALVGSSFLLLASQ